ncbi:MAG: 3-phosphoshikimate 1-carboxyvinyltransferase, partial [Acidiferrobacterales bacterium]
TNHSFKMSIDYVIQPGGRLRGRVRVPGDKSISHRAVILGSLADGPTRVQGLLEGEDVLATLVAFRDMGVGISQPQEGGLTIQGVGLYGLRPPPGPLDMGNSGTAMRLMAGVLAAQTFDSELTGDDSLQKRPMQRVAQPLNAMGAGIATGDGGYPPLSITGGRKLHGIDYVMPLASAQVKSALLLAGLYAAGETAITEPSTTRDHTERLLRAFGYDVTTSDHTVRVCGGGRLTGRELDVPGDLSSAAFFVVGAAIAPEADMTVENVGINPTRAGILGLLQRMGAKLEVINKRQVGLEPVADIRVRNSRLSGIVIAEDEVSLTIDEFPILFVAAACAQGETHLRGAQELRVKESDRIAVMTEGLRRLAIDARETPDGIIIRGGPVSGGDVDSHGDHRVAMAFAMVGLVAQAPVIVRDCKNVDTSFPGFVEFAGRAGLSIKAVTRD